MAIKMVTNWAKTRIRMSFCDVFGLPPRIILTSPNSKITATATAAKGKSPSMKAMRLFSLPMVQTEPRLTDYVISAIKGHKQCIKQCSEI